MMKPSLLTSRDMQQGRCSAEGRTPLAVLPLHAPRPFLPLPSPQPPLLISLVLEDDDPIAAL